MPKNPKLESATKQADLVRERLKSAAPGSTETKKLNVDLGKLEKLISLYEAQDSHAARIAALEEKHTEQTRKDETRLKVIAGAATLWEALNKPDARAGVVALLNRAVKAPRDREFLKTKGWL
jgi:hypothetical protein